MLYISKGSKPYKYIFHMKFRGNMETQKSLKEILQGYINKRPIFKNKEILSTRFTPQNIPYREEQIKQLGLILAPFLRNEKVSNIFIYGKTGTGKTLVCKHVSSNIMDLAKHVEFKVKIIYINCKMKKVSDTEYRLLAQLISNFGEEVPYTGLPTERLYKKFFQILDSEERNVLIILDEVDELVKKVGDGVLYNLTRINEELEKSKVSLIGISNNVSFIDELDPRVKSSLSEEEIIFPPYNANELREILNQRVKSAFNENCVDPAAIAKCAALAAQEHGDARKALDLLRVAGEIAEREGESRVLERHVNLAQSKLDMNRISEIIKTQPKQSKAVLLSIINLHKKGIENIQTGDVYDFYTKICSGNGLTPLTQRRVSDLISELDMFGIVNAKIISKGRYGRTRIISLNLSKKILEEAENLLNKEFY